MSLDPNFGDAFIYWSLRLLLLSVLTYSGYKISYLEDGSKFWRSCTAPLLLYSLIQGLRYMRGTDYSHYMQDLEGNLFTEYREPLYNLWLDIFQISGLPFFVGFIFYSFIFFFSYLCVVKHFQQTAVWALPMFLIITGSGSECFVRQYFALSFILFAFHYYYENNIYAMLISLFICCLIHFSGLFAISLFLLFAYVRIDKIYCCEKPWFFIFLYCVIYFFWDTSYFNIFSEYLQLISIDESYFGSGYIENADRWFSEEGSLSNVHGTKMEVGIILRAFTFISNFCIIWFGWYTIKFNRKMSLFYGFSYLYIIISQISSDIEIYRRFTHWVVCFLPIMYGAIFCYCKWNNIVLKYMVIFVFLITYLFYGTINMIGTKGYAGCGFVWDA